MLALLIVVVAAAPALAANKEMVQLQTQVQALQDAMARMQQSFDERMGVMRNLIEQSTDTTNKLASSVTALQQELQKQHADTGTRVDQVSAQIQALNDSVDELKARMAKVTKQMDDLAAAQQNLPAAGAPAGQPAAGGPAAPPPQPQAPPADVLYNNGLRDYNSGRYDLAVQEFNDYLKYYATTDLAGNAQFYLADILYRQGNYDGAVAGYDKVLEQYPGGNKTAAAQLKKGFALLELGQRQAGVRELKNLIARYPRSIEAQQARDRLRKLTPASSRR
ncbi:MAG TPA: tetratricopeptide repeat protein [Terriglobales bacterium]|nr:tetratricopeptide repeat protein [Terriglobales bacterium]